MNGNRQTMNYHGKTFVIFINNYSEKVLIILVVNLLFPSSPKNLREVCGSTMQAEERMVSLLLNQKKRTADEGRQDCIRHTHRCSETAL